MNFSGGTVETATVDLEVYDYSGTWAWKVWGTGAPADEIVISNDADYDPNRE